MAGTNGKAFVRLHCWRLLRDEPLWKSFRGDKQTPPNVANPDTRATGSAIRPQGTKAAKADAKAAAETGLSLRDLALATKQMAQASNKRTRALQGLNDLAVFSVSLADVDPDAREFFMIRRRQALERLRKSRFTEASRDEGQKEAVEVPAAAAHHASPMTANRNGEAAYNAVGSYLSEETGGPADANNENNKEIVDSVLV